MAYFILNHSYLLLELGIFFLGYFIGFLRGRVSPAHGISALAKKLEEAKLRTHIEEENVKQDRMIKERMQ